MNESATYDQLIEQLQQFGLKAYEARCFVALSRLPQATAREISEISDVPRTRVYDAINVLKTEGLVTVQHSNPQVFRAVRIAEATDTLRRTYESRLQSVRETLETMEPASLDDASEVDHEIWALSGRQAISVRTKQLLSEAETEISLLVDTDIVDAELAEALREASSRDVHVVVGLVGDSDEFDFDLPNVEFVDPDQEFLTCLGFLTASSMREAELPDMECETSTPLSRLLLIDGQTVLLGTNTEATRATVDEQSVCAIGETNGLVVLARRLLAPDCFSAIGDD